MARTLKAGTHVIGEGESLASVAEASGFFELTLWELAENAGLRSARKWPNVLAEGDAVVIPELRQKQAAADTGARHVYRRRGIPAVYRLRLLRGGKPVAAAEYTLTIGDRKNPGVTDDLGRLCEFIPPGAKEGVLQVPGIGMKARVCFGQMDPIGTQSGVEKRLANLGYLAPGPSPASETDIAGALRAFQSAWQLGVTGKCDDATRTALETAHDFKK